MNAELPPVAQFMQRIAPTVFSVVVSAWIGMMFVILTHAGSKHFFFELFVSVAVAGAAYIGVRFGGPPDAFFRSINPAITAGQLPAIRALSRQIVWSIVGLIILALLFIDVLRYTHS
jgi:hypothetical protein